MDGWNTSFLFGARPIFRCEPLVLGECNRNTLKQVTVASWVLSLLNRLHWQTIQKYDLKIPYIIFDQHQLTKSSTPKPAICPKKTARRKAKHHISSPGANHAPNCGNLCVALRSADPLSKRKN